MSKFLTLIAGLSFMQASICDEKPSSNEKPSYDNSGENKSFVPHPDFPSGTAFNPLFRTSAEVYSHMRKYADRGGDHPFVFARKYIVYNEKPSYDNSDENKSFVPHPDFPSGSAFNPLFRTSAEICSHMRKYADRGGDHPLVLARMFIMLIAIDN